MTENHVASLTQSYAAFTKYFQRITCFHSSVAYELPHLHEAVHFVNQQVIRYSNVPSGLRLRVITDIHVIITLILIHRQYNSM
jgi:hypothetical protein